MVAFCDSETVEDNVGGLENVLLHEVLGYSETGGVIVQVCVGTAVIERLPGVTV